jgi:hypothetical protein
VAAGLQQGDELLADCTRGAGDEHLHDRSLLLRPEDMTQQQVQV